MPDASFIHSNTENFYYLLGLDSSANREDIRHAAIEQRALGGDSRVISIATKVLNDPYLRDAYDHALERKLLTGLFPEEIPGAITQSEAAINTPANTPQRKGFFHLFR